MAVLMDVVLVMIYRIDTVYVDVDSMLEIICFKLAEAIYGLLWNDHDDYKQ